MELLSSDQRKNLQGRRKQLSPDFKYLHPKFASLSKVNPEALFNPSQYFAKQPTSLQKPYTKAFLRILGDTEGFQNTPSLGIN